MQDELPVTFEDIAEARNQNEGVDGCIPIFHNRVVEDVAKSEKTGKREYMEVAYVKVLSPGNDKEIPDFRVTETHKKRWPRQWEAFQTGSDIPLEGTPFNKWMGITPVEAKMLQDAGIRTVEELVKVPDLNLKNIGGSFIPLKARAEAFLASQDGEAGFQKLKAELDQVKSQLATRDDQIKGLEDRIDELLTAKTKKSARIKKKDANGDISGDSE